MGKQFTWNILPEPKLNPGERPPLHLITPFVQRVYSRRFQGPHAMIPELYASGSLEVLRDPFDMPDLMQGAQCLVKHLEQRSRVAIFCDYDVDGICGGTLLRQFIQTAYPKASVTLFQSNRMMEGYGLNLHHVDRLSDFACIITTDCGSSSIEPIAQLAQSGCDVIITDHHECAYDQEGRVIRPNARAFINPKRSDNPHYFSFLSGTGVAFLLCSATRKLSPKCAQVKLSPFIDLICASIIADAVPLINENRVLVRYGLKLFNEKPRPFFKKLLEDNKRGGPITESTLAFSLIPKLNAPGRMGDATPVLEGLMAQTDADIETHFQETLGKNQERMKIQTRSWRLIEPIGEEQKDADVICIFHPDIHEGVVGILASRLCEKYHKPAIVLATSQIPGEIRGSGRSYGGVSLLDIIHKYAGHFTRYGGHHGAVGLTLHESNLRPLLDDIRSHTFKSEPATLNIEQEITLNDLTMQAAQELETLSPFGQAFPEPLFLIRNARIPKLRLLKEDHLKGILDTGEPPQIEFVAWKQGHLASYISGSNRYSVVVKIKLNHYQRRTSIQCELLDIEKVTEG